VRDEWDNDLLHVTYDPAEVTVEEILETIRSEGFKGEVRRP